MDVKGARWPYDALMTASRLPGSAIETLAAFSDRQSRDVSNSAQSSLWRWRSVAWSSPEIIPVEGAWAATPGSAAKRIDPVVD